MDFSKNERLHQWETIAKVQGRQVTVSIDCSYSESSLATLVDQTLSQLAEAWPQIESNIIESLHRLYNEQWARPDEGLPRVTAGDFLRKIVLDAVDVAEEALTLYFSDSDLFAGHLVEIFQDSDGKLYPAQLIG